MTYSKFSIIDPNAKIGKNVKIGPFCVIEGDVEIGDNCVIESNASIMNGTTMGEGCKVFPGAIVGAVPQDLKFKGEYSTITIGKNTIIREYCTLNRGTAANFQTKIGDNCLLMAYVHVAHDCVIGNNCILANNVNLAGHIVIHDFAVLGGISAIHQFVKIGAHAMLGGGSLVRKDIPPYVKAAREPLSYAGVNSIGLKRRGFSTEQINHIQAIYRTIFVKGYNTSQALKIVETTIDVSPERDYILSFIKGADRGVMKGFNQL